jgi:hypothetical protein
MNRLTTAQPSANGTTRKAPRASKPPRKSTTNRMRQPLTVALGCGIPALSLTLSHIGVELIQTARPCLGGSALVLCGAVLAVSLDHLRSAIQDITHSRLWQAWCLAVAVDCALVVCELTRVAGFQSWAVPCLMGAVTVASMGLNCWAFLNHPPSKKSK